MAAPTSSPGGGFSYAQAAKGRQQSSATQATPSKPASSAATTVGNAVTEFAPGGNWADDVEATVRDRPAESQKPAQESSKQAPAKDSAVERAKLEEKSNTVASGVSSPDLAGSASPTTKDDESSTAPTNGSSETTWETKSQASEPSWIADRKERQSNTNKSESTVKSGKKPKGKAAEEPAPPPVVLHEAAVPTVNPWMQRSAKFAAQQPAPKPATTPMAAEQPAQKENQRPRSDSRKKVGSVSGAPRNGETLGAAANDVKRPNGVTAKRVNDVRGTQQGAKSLADDAFPSAGRPGASMLSSIPNGSAAAPPPAVKDEMSWPTPETAQEKERKEAGEKVSPEKTEKTGDDATPSNKPRKKQEWQAMIVTPNILFETPNIRGRDTPRSGPGSERGGRGGMRGRGGFRGATAAGSVDRSAGRANAHVTNGESNATGTQRGVSDNADREAMPPPAKPIRSASENARREQQSDGHTGSGGRGQIMNEVPGEVKADVQRKSEWAGMAEMPRTASPTKVNGSLPESNQDRAAESIARQGSTSTPRSENSAGSRGPPPRIGPTDVRKETRGFENGFREPNFNGLPRGGKRNGRGRGGSREFMNGHQANHTFTNGDFAAAGFGAPISPSYRGNHQFGYGRGGFSRGNPRSQSIPMEGFYGRGLPYGQAGMPHVQPYMQGMYEYGYPMSAMPYQPYFDQQYLMDMVSTQLEYYFSIDNLLKDMFLRKNMDSQGFVFLDVVAGFNRLKQLTQDKELLKAVCLNSEAIEIRVGEDGKERLRRREGWDQFLLPLEQREAGAQTEGPKEVHRPERPQLQMFGPSPARGPQSAVLPGMPPRFDRRSYDAGFQMYNGMPPYSAFPAVPEAAYAEMMGGEDVRGRATKSPHRDNEMSPFQQAQAEGEKDLEPDAFPEDQVHALTVVVKPRPQAPFHSAATRTFSNGSIDSRSIFGEMDKAGKTGDGQEAQPQTNGETMANGTANSESASRHPSPSTSRSNERDPKSAELSVFWMKDETVPSEAPTGVSLEPYVQLRLKALSQRSQAATGTCPYDLDVLYQFWCHFLIRNFNSRMYNEFKYYAIEDGKERHNITGMQNLVKFYAQALLSHNPIRDRLVRDYVELVNTEPAKLDGAAFKNLRSAWRNGALNLKNRKKLSDIVDDSLKERLES